MIQRKIVFSLSGLLVAMLPATSAAVPAAAGAGASSSTTTVSTSPAAGNVTAVAPVQQKTPEVTPAVGPHVRGGGLFRLALGSGFMFGSTKLDDGTTLSKKGLTFASDLSLGFTATPGLAIGAGVFGNVPAAATEENGPTFIALACPFADVYVDPSDGFHLVGGPCYAMARYENQGVWLQGWGANLGIGYEWKALWGSNLGRGWGLGLLARVQYANLAGKGTNDPFSAILPSLLIAATWY
jgi:hypothetical protein